MAFLRLALLAASSAAFAEAAGREQQRPQREMMTAVARFVRSVSRSTGELFSSGLLEDTSDPAEADSPNVADTILTAARLLPARPSRSRRGTRTQRTAPPAQTDWHRGSGVVAPRPQRRAPQPQRGARARRRGRVLQDDGEDDDEKPGLDKDAERAFEESQGGINMESIPPFCENGIIIHRDPVIECPGNVSVDYSQWRALPPSVRQYCWVRNTTDEEVWPPPVAANWTNDGLWNSSYCLCPKDATLVPGWPNPARATCLFRRDLRCEIELLSPSPAECPPRVRALDWTRPCHWRSTADVQRVAFTVNCSLDPTEDDPQPWEPFDDGQVYASTLPLTLQVPGGGEGRMTPLSLEGARALYPYRAVGRNGSFGLSPNHWLLSDQLANRPRYGISLKLYSFNRISDEAWRVDTALAQVEDGYLTAERTIEFSIPFATVPPRYFVGGRLYAETGMLFSSNHTMRLYFDFTDYVPPQPDSTQQTAMANAVIALGVIFGVCTLCAAATFRWQKRESEVTTRHREDHEHWD